MAGLDRERATGGNGNGAGHGGDGPRSLKDELASLRIERRPTGRAPATSTSAPARRPSRGGGFGMRLLAWVIWLIPLGLIGGAAALAYKQYDRIRAKPEVKVARVQAMTVNEAEKLLTAKGYIKSRNQAMIGAKVPGRVEKMLVEEGTHVRTGDLIAVLEHNDTDALLESRQAQLRRTEAELAEARADLVWKRRKAERRSDLRSRGQVVAQEEVDEAIAGREMSAARVAALEAAVKLMASQVREMQETIRNMHIVAPFDGTVVAKEAEVGETITPGGMGASSGRGSVVTLANLSMLEVETDVTESLLSRVKLNQPAEVSVGAVPNKRYRGRLRRIIPMGDRSRGTVKVMVEILDPDGDLFPELVATVHFLPTEREAHAADTKPSLFLPRTAVVEEGGHDYAWVVDAQGFARRRPIEVVTSNDLARVEKGLSEGETVVDSPNKALKEGEAVKVVE